jgi:hypothetical protein
MSEDSIYPTIGCGRHRRVTTARVLLHNEAVAVRRVGRAQVDDRAAGLYPGRDLVHGERSGGGRAVGGEARWPPDNKTV